MTESNPPQNVLMDINDEDVIFYVEGYSKEINERAKDCAHMMTRWHLFDSEANEWRKECVFCPAVLEQEFSKNHPG